MPKTKSLRQQRHLSWELLEKRIASGPPSVERIDGRPLAEIFVGPAGMLLGLRVFGAAGVLPASPLAEVDVSAVGAGKRAAVEVTTSNTALYRVFYAFCCDVVDRIQLDGERIGPAIAETLRKWASLLRHKPLMPEDKQLGLLGELWFLEHLAGKAGWPAAARAWRGPDAEEHDFTLRRVDIEVKTTRSEKRIHVIGSLTQLLPKKNRSLYVLSVQFTPASGTAGGHSLAAAVAGALTRAGEASADAAALVRKQAERYGWDDEDARLYTQEWLLRTDPVLVRVNSKCPAIVPETLRTLGDRLDRIGRITYEVNLTGLGVPEGSASFAAIVRN